MDPVLRLEKRNLPGKRIYGICARFIFCQHSQLYLALYIEEFVFPHTSMAVIWMGIVKKTEPSVLVLYALRHLNFLKHNLKVPPAGW